MLIIVIITVIVIFLVCPGNTQFIVSIVDKVLFIRLLCNWLIHMSKKVVA